MPAGSWSRMALITSVISASVISSPNSVRRSSSRSSSGKPIWASPSSVMPPVRSASIQSSVNHTFMCPRCGLDHSNPRHGRVPRRSVRCVRQLARRLPARVGDAQDRAARVLLSDHIGDGSTEVAAPERGHRVVGQRGDVEALDPQHGVKRERVTRAIGQVAVVVEVGVDQSEAGEQSGTPLGTRTPCGSERRAQRRVRVEDHQGAGSRPPLSSSRR
jgi:hypothetical protein